MSEISEIRELGETAYGGYCQASGGKSLVSGASLPLWDEQAPEIRQAWNLAAMAVVDRWQQAGEDAPGSEPKPAPGLAALRERLARAEGDRNAARNVVAEMHAHWQRDGATPEQEELFLQWLAAAGLTDGATAEPQPAPELAAERDGLRKALRAISLGIAEPSPQSVARDALNGRRYFDPDTDAGVWSMSDPAEQVRLARQDRDQLRKRVLAIAAELDDSAAETAPSRKSEIEREIAAALRKTAEPPA